MNNAKLHVDNLLARHMGTSFYRLSPLLQAFHTGKKTLQGLASVRRGKVLAKLLCWVMRFPRQSNAVNLRVDCDHLQDAMHWQRYFGNHRMASSFYENGNFLVERLNGLHLSLQATEREGSLVYNFSRATFLGIPIPLFLCPRVEAWEKEVDGDYEFFVEVEMWLVGLIISYWGRLKILDIEVK